MDRLPEIAAADAPPSVQAVYADLCRLSGVPMVALIYRHIATYPGVLETVWGNLRPLFAAGVLQESAWRIARNSVDATLIPPFDRGALASIGLDGANARPVLDTFDAYNRTNPVNLLTMLCLLQRVRDPHTPGLPVQVAAWSPPAIGGPLPPMTPPDRMPTEMLRQIKELQTGDTAASDQVIPSLFRHLTPWPDYMTLLHAALMPRVRNGGLLAATGQLRTAMQAEAAHLAKHLAPVEELARLPELVAVIDRFTRVFIPQMIVIGSALRRAMPQD